MINDEFNIVGLYEHNADSYRKVREAFDSGEDIVSIVHATGTGKSFNALQLAFDNKDKKIVYVVPSNGIIEHLKKIIEDNPNLSLERDFPNLEFRTYQSLLTPYKEDRMEEIECDLLILDEFHHVGAPIWGKTIDKLIETHPNIKIFGMTAYTVRDRGTSYERDMADPDTDELFSGTIESTYDLCDAMIDGVLPKPIYKSAYTNLIGMEQKLEEKVQKLGVSTKEYQEYMSILNDVKKRIQEAPSIPNILRKSIKSNGKYIYFCPPFSEDGVNDIETIKKQAIEWFKQFAKEENIIIYTTTSDMGEDGKKNRDAFYDDVTLDGKKLDNKLRVMFAINQYNEGIHAPNIDGVIMGRGTTSDIVYFEQLGRALSVRGNTKEMFEKLEKYSLEELTLMCQSKDIMIKESDTKEDLIEKLIAPVVIDLTNNFGFIKELENNLKDRIRDIQSDGLGSHRDIKIRDASFDIEIENQDLFEMLKYVLDMLTMTWEDYYELAKNYYEEHGNLEIMTKFKTFDGFTYDENGVPLGDWIRRQRKAYNEKGTYKITEERIALLSKIGMRWINKNVNLTWDEWYKLAQKYYEKNGNLEILAKFKTFDGFTYDKNGVSLGSWIERQRDAYNGKGTYKITEERIALLSKIGMRWDNIDIMEEWMEKYNLSKAYYEKNGDLEVPVEFYTFDGYTYDENGVPLGQWIKRQRESYNGKHDKITEERIALLSKIGMRWGYINNIKWMNKYNLAKAYFEHYGNLEIPTRFKTKNGYEYAENGIKLGIWIYNQRNAYKGKGMGKITEEQIKLLEKIGMRWGLIDNMPEWMKKYNLAKEYYEKYGDLEIPFEFKTFDGFTFDENGVPLGDWIKNQRKAYNGKHYKITEERIALLSKIGMRWGYINNIEWTKKYNLAKAYYEKYGNLEIPKRFYTFDGYTYDENGVPLGDWIQSQRQAYNGKGHCKITEEQIESLSQIGMIWNVKKNKDEVKGICELYGINYDKNKTILKHISAQELKSKIEFLMENNISIITDQGKLIDIFDMSSFDMKEKYGLSLEEMIDKYYIKKQDSKGV